ncbi:MAG: hypothetical protein KAR11_04145 [Phycisphaerae bacterium]|nr:hypothetical protein [Phycisphaerae bacterium]
MKSSNRNFTTFGAILCVILFLGVVLITSPAYSKKAETDDTDTELIDTTDDAQDDLIDTDKVDTDKVDADESDKIDKPKKPAKRKKSRPKKTKKSKKSGKNTAEDFGDNDAEDDDDSALEIEEDHPVIPELEYDVYVELARIAKLNEKQQKKLVFIQHKREKGLEGWDKTHGKRLEKMQRKAAGENKESRRRKLDLKVKAFEDKRDALAERFDVKARRVCTKDQLVAYNSTLLYRAAIDEFNNMQIPLDDEEAEKIKKACEGYAKKKLKNPKVDLYRHEKTLRKGIYEVAKKALTKRQFKEYKRIKKREELLRRRELKEEYENERKNNRKKR